MLLSVWEKERDLVWKYADSYFDALAMPDEVARKATLLAKQHANSLELPTRDYFVLAGALSYGPRDYPLPFSKYLEIRKFVDKQTDPRFAPADLVQTVFAYGVGADRFRGKETRAATSWDNPWVNAELTLRKFVLDVAEEATVGLEQLGIGEAILHDGALEYLPEVLRGRWQDAYVDYWLDHHNNVSRETVATRHRDKHLLSGWLNQRGWPPRYRKKVFPLRDFVWHAVMGDKPNHPKGFEKGLLFPLLKSYGVPFRVVAVLRCCGPNGDPHSGECSGLFGDFAICGKCGTRDPSFKKTFRIIREDDPRFQRLAVRRCMNVGCEHFCSADELFCQFCEKFASELVRGKKRRLRETRIYRYLPAPDQIYLGQRGFRGRGRREPIEYWRPIGDDDT